MAATRQAATRSHHRVYLRRIQELEVLKLLAVQEFFREYRGGPRVHPVSGRKVLFVNPQFTIAIKDMDERESRSLRALARSEKAALQPFRAQLRWKPV